MAKVGLIALYSVGSMSLRQVHAMLEEAGHEVFTIFMKELRWENMLPPTEQEIDMMIGIIKKENPAFVGIGVRSTYFQVARGLTERIQALGIPVVWGGVHPTVSPDQSIKLADAIFQGECDDAIVEYANTFDGGGDKTQIRNCWVRNGEEVFRNPYRELEQDLDRFPFPNWNDEHCYYIENNRTLRSLQADLRPSYMIMTQRGCPYQCTFCIHNVTRPMYQDKGKYVRRRSVENVVRELEVALERFPNMRRVYFFDDVFTINLNWMKEFGVAYEKRIGLPFTCFTEPRMISAEILQVLKTAGLYKIYMGIQSGSEKVREEIMHRYDPDDVIVHAARLIKESGVSGQFDIIEDNPFEGEGARYETLDLLLRLPRPFELKQHSLTWFPNYIMTNLALERGLIKEEELEDQRGKSLERWQKTLDFQRKDEDMFWDALYLMTKVKLVPRSWIRKMSKNKWLESHAMILAILMYVPARFHNLFIQVRDTYREFGVTGVISGARNTFLRRGELFID